MKSHLFIAFSLLATSQIFAQSFPGYKMGNYSGVNGVFFNPANIADSRFKFDLNLLSVNATFGNDQASFSLKDFNSSFNSDYILNQLEGPNSTPATGMLNADIHGPSFMLNTGKKSAIAFTTRFRTIGNFRNMDIKLLKALGDQLSGNENLPYNFYSDQNMKMAVNVWTEIGLSYARELKKEGPHYMKGGITFKYLGGVTGGFANLSQMRGTIMEAGQESEVYLANTTGQIGMGISRPRIEDLNVPDQKKFTSSGIGADIGFIYEFRPDHQINTEENRGKNKNKYKYQIAIALLDLGKLKSNRGDNQFANYDMNVNENERFNVQEIENLDLDDLNDFFLSRPQFFTPSNNALTEYNYSLPTSIQFGLDYFLRGRLYINLTGQLPIGKESITKSFNNKLYTSLTLTPRLEGKTIGVYLPVQYNKLTGLIAGASLRIGPGFIGSGSVLTALMGKSKQVDFHMGLRFGILRKS